MPYYVLYTALLLLGCFLAGATLACMLRKAFRHAPATAAVAGVAGAAAAATGPDIVADRAGTDNGIVAPTTAAVEGHPVPVENAVAGGVPAEPTIEPVIGEETPEVVSEAVSAEADREPAPSIEADTTGVGSDEIPPGQALEPEPVERSESIFPDAAEETASDASVGVQVDEVAHEPIAGTEDRNLEAQPLTSTAGTPAATAAIAAATAAAGAAFQTTGAADDLTRVKGIDADAQSKLNEIGISQYEQIASLTSADVATLGTHLDAPHRMSRQGWIEQSAILARGRETYYSERQARGDYGTGRTATKPEATPAPSAAPAPPTEELRDQAVGISPDDAPRDITDRLPGSERAERPDGEQRTPRPESEPQEPRVGQEPRAARTPREERQDREREIRDRSNLRSVRSGEAREPRVAGGGRMVRSAEADDLKRIRGVGVVIEKKLNAMGITTYGQIAKWTPVDIQRVNGVLDFIGRIERENWIEQARVLRGSGITNIANRADRGEVESSRNDS